MAAGKKFLTVLGLFVFLIILSGFHAFYWGGAEGDAVSTKDLNGKRLGGIVSRMPDNSSRILFESILGEKLSGYTSYKTVDEALYALRSGEVSALWFCDVSADYLVDKAENLVILNDGEPESDRFEFGLAVRNDAEGEALCDSLNEAIEIVKNNGVLDGLISRYLENEQQDAEDSAVEVKYEGDMLVNNADAYKDSRKLYIGVSGTVPPLDMIDVNGKPYGFCVEFMDELGQIVQRRVEFVVLGNETMFSALMAGRIDAVLCYGSGRNTVDTGKDYLVTDGYYGMSEYKFVALKPHSDGMEE